MQTGPTLLLSRIAARLDRAPTRRLFLAARILPFRSPRPAASAAFPPVTGAVCPEYTPRSAKVIVLSKAMRKQSARSVTACPHPRPGVVEYEMGQGYLEVERDGMSLRRFLYAWTVLFRGARSHTTGNVRSVVRMHPAH